MKNLRFHVLIIIVLGYSLLLLGQQRHTSFFVKRHTTNVTTIQVDTLNNRTTHGRSVSTTLAQKTALAALRTWWITAQGKDTSRVYKTHPFMSFKWIGRDTAVGGGTVALRLKVFMSGTNDTTTLGYPQFAEFVLIDSTDLTSDSTKTPYVFTSSGSNRPNWEYYYLTVEGLAGNSATAVRVDIEDNGYGTTR